MICRLICRIFNAGIGKEINVRLLWRLKLRPQVRMANDRFSLAAFASLRLCENSRLNKEAHLSQRRKGAAISFSKTIKAGVNNLQGAYATRHSYPNAYLFVAVGTFTDLPSTVYSTRPTIISS